MNLLKSEWRKLIYVRAHWGLLIAAILVALLGTAVTPVILDSNAEAFGLGLDQPDAIDAVYANAISSYFFAIIIGIMLMSGEFRHGTSVATFLTAPKRGTVLANKLAIAAIGGALVMVIATASGLLGGWVALQFFDNVAEPSSGVFLNTMIAAVVSGAILGIVGVALGTLVRNQMLAITGSLIYLFVIDPILLTLAPEAGKWLPSGLITAMLALDVQAPELGFDTTNYLPALTATIVLLGYGLVFGAIAIATSLRRDIE
ncbi:MAG: ABC transporter permease subunit [Micrococcales bacterium]|jgi:ABC-2 type transport system permease protein|nr:ABC transporter permease subunit [Micrococcales bacterium]MBT5431798.1 ABC transporter permease subunit [Micrococcales bacterium]MBT5848649.1 ABC transporter permease subunit [Micrococcales bacterium]